MIKSWGHPPGATRGPAAGASGLTTSQDLIAHSLEHGEFATFSEVVAQGLKPSARPQRVEVYEARDGTRAVARAADIEAEERKAEQANWRRIQANADALWHHRQREPDVGDE